MRASPRRYDVGVAALAVIAALSSACAKAREVSGSPVSCGPCHGAPPESGAHRAHVGAAPAGALLGYGNLGALVEDGPDGLSYRFGCGNCHPIDAQRHMDGSLEVELSDAAAPPASLKAQSAADASYADGRCAGVYCHGGGGQSWGRGVATPPWNGPPGRLACDACHGGPPGSGAHLTHAGDPEAASLVRYGDQRALADYRPEGGPAYLFGCGSCHPVAPQHHVNGQIEVALDPLAAAPNTLRSENADDAGYAAGRCAGVYCHSSGQAATVRTYAETPDWYGVSGTLGCSGCHGNPPRYANGGPGAGANGHLIGIAYGAIMGHVGTAVNHGRQNHGGGLSHLESQSAGGPITCQTCHAGTVDPTNTGPTGFYYLDTSGDYVMPGVTPYVCGSCHTGLPGEQPAGKGKVLPLLHVNGRRDVLFDRRATLPSGYPGFPAGTPARPYWHYEADGIGIYLDGVDAVAQGLGWATPQGEYAAVLSMNLVNAQWDPATKSCSSVACHLHKQTWAWGTPMTNCESCHSNQ